MKYKIIFGEKRIGEMQSDLGSKNWPEFMQHDAIVAKHWSCLYSDFLDYQVAAQSVEGIVGVGNSIPIHWEGKFNELPDQGLDWAMEKAVNDFNNGLTPNLLVGFKF